MAWILSSTATDASTGASLAGAYLKIRSSRIDHTGKTASIACELFASEAARQGNLTPLRTYEVEFDDGETLAAQQFTCNFAPMPVPPAATNYDNLVEQEYVSLQNHPAMNGLLAGATAS